MRSMACLTSVIWAILTLQFFSNCRYVIVVQSFLTSLKEIQTGLSPRKMWPPSPNKAPHALATKAESHTSTWTCPGRTSNTWATPFYRICSMNLATRLISHCPTQSTSICQAPVAQQIWSRFRPTSLSCSSQITPSSSSLHWFLWFNRLAVKEIYRLRKMKATKIWCKCSP